MVHQADGKTGIGIVTASKSGKNWYKECQ
jgi:hypothetical protein